MPGEKEQNGGGKGEKILKGEGLGSARQNFLPSKTHNFGKKGFHETVDLPGGGLLLRKDGRGIQGLTLGKRTIFMTYARRFLMRGAQEPIFKKKKKKTNHEKKGLGREEGAISCKE